MTVTLTNREMLLLIGALRELSNMELNTKFAFWVAKTARDVDGVYDVYEKSRNALIEKYAEKDENGEYLYEDAEKTRVKVGDGFWTENAELLDAKGADVRQISVEFVDSGVNGKLSTAIAVAMLPVIAAEEV